MTWDKELEELALRRRLAQQMGGEEKLKRHRDNGKLPVRERITGLVDEGSTVEVGGLAGTGQYDEEGRLQGFTPSNFLMARARVEGRPVVVVGDDFTVRGGANDGAVGDKLIVAEQMAHDLRLPLIRLVDGTGGGGSVKSIELKGHTLLPKLKAWPYIARNLATVPVVGMGLGSVAGMGAARVAASHYSVMVKDISQLFVAGPPVVARTGQDLSKNELGGSQIHTRNGVVDDEVATEQEAFARARRFLSYLPPSIYELPPRSEAGREAGGDQVKLRAAIPKNTRSVYKIRNIVDTLVDAGSFMEIGRHWGKAIATGLARTDGWPVAVVASDPYHYGGAWDRQTAEKYMRMVDLAELFHLPVLNLVDVPGFRIGLDAEKEGVMRAGVRALTAVSQSTVPWCTVIIRKAFGVAGGGHQNPDRYNFRYAWPSAQWGSLPIEGGLEVAYKAELAAAPDPEAALARIEARVRGLTSPFRSAEAFVVEDIVDPAETRGLLVEFANLVAPLRQPGRASFGFRP
ncbi:acyl-CoA carboxylase subunit beta [Noviherbaspirillum sp. Root189]|uniref:acyl-CoA carboxylase subunit beta n=1 Tax=Noviherbaspirillum sp. Root189 TaxID=1736487 RepID=UPI00070C4E8B|nr:carboxyl transferase domain-containing protein [Noviherbaspirillum sp. Root189]KRB67984.1 methylmalonyl-CoA carboxyltransferase [Noviherbaspirillum sp. Root189]